MTTNFPYSRVGDFMKKSPPVPSPTTVPKYSSEHNVDRRDRDRTSIYRLKSKVTMTRKLEVILVYEDGIEVDGGSSRGSWITR